MLTRKGWMNMADPYRFDTGGQGPQKNTGPNQQNQQNNYNYNFGYGTPRSPQQPSRPPKNSGGAGDWIGMGILFLIPLWLTKVIAVVWFVRKLAAMDKEQKSRYRQEAQRAAGQARRTAEQIFHQPTQAGQNAYAGQDRPQTGQGAPTGQNRPQPDGWNVRDQSQTRQQAAKKQARKDSASGTSLIIGGGIMSAIFALGSAATSIEYLRYAFHGGGLFNDELIGVLACMMFLAGGLTMLFSGIGMNRRSERYVNYLAYIGANREVALAPMAASFGIPVNKLCKDLRRMLAKGVLPSGYLDLAEGKLYLTEMGYRAPEPKQEPKRQEAEETPRQAAEREDDILRQIRQVNDEIPDADMTAKINRIEEITGKILAYQKSHPNREGQLRSFLNYYLPTTLKILRAYAQLEAQGIEGKNISAAKTRIEGMMDQVVAGFEKQLDRLFQDDAMDITSDVEVLENMLKKDGLSNDGISITL